MHYSVAYPCDYDSEEDRLYPLVLSVGGSGELGDDKRILVQTDPGCIITKYRNFFENDKYRAFHVTLQIPTSGFTEEVPTPEMSPYHDGWSRYYHERSHGMIGAREIVNMLIADPDHKIDPNKIYLTGFSGGGLFSFEGLKGLRDVLAAAVPVAAWPIGGAYRDVLNDPYWDTPYADGKESLKDRLKKEMFRSRHIPTIIGVGTNDNMKFGSRAFQLVADEIGKDSQLKEYPASHGGSPKRVWGDPDNVEWLFSQTKQLNLPIDPYPDVDYTDPLNPRSIEMFKLTAENSGYYYVYVEGVEVSKHVAEREAIEIAQEQKTLTPEKEVWLEHDYKVRVDKEDAGEVQP